MSWSDYLMDRNTNFCIFPLIAQIFAEEHPYQVKLLIESLTKNVNPSITHPSGYDYKQAVNIVV